MQIKIDENLPSRLVDALSTLSHHVDTVPDEGLAGRSDSDVWAAAQAAGRFLITPDLDFSDIRRFRPGSHPAILLLRLRNPGRAALFAKVVSIFEKEAVETWVGCFVVATDRKLRIRRPQ